MVVSGDDDAEHSSRMCSSNDAADSNDAKSLDVNTGVSDHQDKDEVMVDAHGKGEELSPNVEAHVPNGNVSKKMAVPESDEAQGRNAQPAKDPGEISDSGLAQDTDGSVKNGRSRKRKSKTIHYMNSRVPHAVPALESEEGSDGPESPEEGDDVLVRPSQASRVAATKVGVIDMSIYFDLECICSLYVPFMIFVMFENILSHTACSLFGR